MSSHTTLSAPVIQEHEGFLVLRDDLLDGGTKRRALTQILPHIDADEVVYPATAYGYGQLALAYAGRDFGKKVSLFIAARKNLERAPLVREALEKAGATYHFVPFPNFMNVVTNRAAAYCAQSGAHLMPLGFASESFMDALVAVAQALPITPPQEVWVAGGTGTLARALTRAWPQTPVNVVSMGMKNGNMGHAKVWRTSEKFTQKARKPPPFPSAPHYDAKVWQFVQAHARKGALVWNVGK